MGEVNILRVHFIFGCVMDVWLEEWWQGDCGTRFQFSHLNGSWSMDNISRQRGGKGISEKRHMDKTEAMNIRQSRKLVEQIAQYICTLLKSQHYAPFIFVVSLVQSFPNTGPLIACIRITWGALYIRNFQFQPQIFWFNRASVGIRNLIFKNLPS